MKTKVIFRTFRQGGDTCAFFPELPADRCPSHCMSYAHFGQHGAALAYWSRSTRPATPAEVRPLARELRRIGYSLRVCKRVSQAMHATRHAAIGI